MAFTRGKYAKAISDRSGMEFPYNEMVKEWNGHFVHKSEYEEKHPQLELKSRSGDSQGLRDARPARTENEVAALLGNNPFSITASSQTITVTEINHGRSSSDTVRFRNVRGSPGGVSASTFENSSGFSITVTTTDKYTFSLGATPSVTEKGGGPTVSAGPVSLSA
jgi:hypothetical protein